MAMLCGSAPTQSSQVSKSELYVLDRVAQAWQGISVLTLPDDLPTDEFQHAAQEFLSALESACCTFEATCASRRYRKDWPENYRQLFSGSEVQYHFHLLSACMDQRLPDVILNGLKIEHTDESGNSAARLRQRLSHLGTESLAWRRCEMRSAVCPALPTRKLLRAMFAGVDRAWVDFERLYIGELIVIEQAARDLLVQAANHERRVSNLESLSASSWNVQAAKHVNSELERLIDYVRQLHNAAGLAHRCGFNGASVEKEDAKSSAQVMWIAEQVLRLEGEATHSHSELTASQLLASDVVESFRGVRGYLSLVIPKMRWVDPNLRMNRGLVERLTKWGECWEAATRYLLPSGVRRSMNSVVTGLRRAGELAPEFANMYETQDAELFLVLPRLVWLLYFASPEMFAPLLKSLLPHRFEKDATELAVIAAAFRDVKALLESHTLDVDPWQTHVVFAVGADNACNARRQTLGSEICEAVIKLMRDLEPWSMELQRYRPTEWNQCSAILVRCLVGAMGVHDEADRFNV